MTDRASHLQQARANRDFAEHLHATQVADPTAMQWAVTAAFYCSLHCLEAHLDGFGEHSKTHHARLQKLILGPTAVPVDVSVAYKQLKQWSEDARYRLGAFSGPFVRAQVLDGYLKTVTDFVHL